MGIFTRLLGYAGLGAGKVPARRAWESDDYIESARSAAEAGMWIEAVGRDLLEEEFDLETKDSESRKFTHPPYEISWVGEY